MSRKQQKPALGKGIASLLEANSTASEFLKDVGTPTSRNEKPKQATPEKVEGEAKSGVSMVPIEAITINPHQPRKIFKEKDLLDLTNSIKESGLIQPLVVTQADKGKFELIAGERRLRASKAAGLERVPVIFKKVTDREKLTLAIIENVQRSDLNCIEEALAYFQLIEDFNLTQEETAKKIGKDRSAIANHLRLLKLPREVVQLLQAEKLTFGHGKILAGISENEKALRLAREVVAQKLSVRELEKLAKKRPVAPSAPKSDLLMNERLNSLKDKLEKTTGFHFDINSGKAGSGVISIKYSNEAEFNDIFEYLVKK